MLGKLKKAISRDRSHDIKIRAVWDDSACVWVATSKDVPGLITEAATQEELVAKLRVMVPELLEINSPAAGSSCMPLELNMRGRRNIPMAC